MSTTWKESYPGPDPSDPKPEQIQFEQFARDMMAIQLKIRQRTKAGAVERAFHAKPLFESAHATLRIVENLPDDLQAGWVRRAEQYPVVVRFSNASSMHRPDAKPDMRGFALRVHVAEDEQHDLLMSNFPVSHARDARQFVEFAKATAGGGWETLLGLLGLVFTFGPFETVRMLRNISASRNRRVRSLALETYWSRGACRWGETLAVRYLLRPADAVSSDGGSLDDDADDLTYELTRRLQADAVRFTLCVQRYVDAERTPIEDAAVEWREEFSPAIPVAVLTIARRDSDTADDRAEAKRIEELSFNPWNTTDEFRPLGNLNRARKTAYDASAAQRLGLRWLTQEPLRNVIFGALSRALFQLINRFVAWHRLPAKLGLLNLDGFRFVLRQKNLIGTDVVEAPPTARSAPPPIPEETRSARTYDGTYNDLSAPAMGAAGATFGRNLEPKYRPDLFDTPSAIEVSERLLKRETFVPATSLNILAAAWIQFQVHDWVAHPRLSLGEQDIVVPLPDGMTFTNQVGRAPESEMRIAGNPGAGAIDGSPILFRTAATHWWDCSEIYGSDPAGAQRLRDGARLRLPGGYLSHDIHGQEITGFNESWWLGLSAMQTLFAREHNLLCDELQAQYRAWSDERVYQTARLIVSALVAKIHTIEWTPAILATEIIDIGLNSNWSGPPTDWLTQLGVWLIDAHSLTGIPGRTVPDHGAAPYSLTEDFITVYRMHPLIPDDYVFFSGTDGSRIVERSFTDIQGPGTDAFMREITLTNALYSFGIANPGAITLHNFPETLRRFTRTGNAGNNEIVDLSVIDIVRTRRRGIPRYNDFREGLHMPRITRWEDLTADPASVETLKDVYGDIDLVDTVVGLLAETPPTGFGFSDTAFRIFILMASRRLQSDRFLTVDFRPEIYSPFGMDWIAKNGMTSLILRHCPELAAVLPREGNAFAPWRSIVPKDFGRAGTSAP
jgi:hypothetical protein